MSTAIFRECLKLIHFFEEDFIMKKISVLILLLLCMLSSAAYAKTINYTPENQVRVVGSTKSMEPITLMLVKKTADDYNVIVPSDVGYVAQAEKGTDNKYVFSFKFSGDIRDYNVVVRQGNEIINDTIETAETKMEAVNAQLTVFNSVNQENISIALVAAQIENYFFEDMTYKMIIAFYDKDNRLITAAVVNNGILVKDQEKYSGSAPIPENAYKIKAFIWTDNSYPLGSANEIGGNESTELPFKLYLVGDSICCDYGNEDTERVGWGSVINDKFVDGVTVENCAVRGQSTNTYLNGVRSETEAEQKNVAWWWSSNKKWDEIISDSNAGDYVLIALGANDKAYYERNELLVGSSIEDYKKNLNTFITQAHDVGVNVVLINSTPRYIVSNTDNVIRDYAEAMLEVGKERNVTTLDLNQKLYDYYEAFGFAEAEAKYFTSDSLHINRAGAELCSEMIIGLIRDSLSPLKNFIKE